MNDEQTPATKQTNALGLAGFIVSLVGLCGSGGLLSPIGLIMSLVALKDRPKGFAIAGVVIGALGSCGLLIPFIVLLFVLPVVLITTIAAGGAALAAAGVVLTIAAIFGMSDIEAMIEMSLIAEEARQYDAAQGQLPEDLDAFASGLSQDRLNDPWDQPYRYEILPDGGGFRLWSVGEDGQDGTSDDIEMTFSKDSSGDWTGTGKSGSGISWDESGELQFNPPDPDASGIDQEIPDPGSTPDAPEPPAEVPAEPPAEAPTETPSSPQ